MATARHLDPDMSITNPARPADLVPEGERNAALVVLHFVSGGTLVGRYYRAVVPDHQGEPVELISPVPDYTNYERGGSCSPTVISKVTPLRVIPEHVITELRQALDVDDQNDLRDRLRDILHTIDVFRDPT